MATGSLISELRSHAGPDSVVSRCGGEQRARRLLETKAGSMTIEDARLLGREVNTSFWDGAETHGRFMPAFTGSVWTSLLRDLPKFNEFTSRVWNASEDEALELVGEVLASHWIWPHAAPSTPTLLMYLRNPDRYVVALESLAKGLGRLTGNTYSLDGVDGYVAYCRDAHALAKAYGLAPQEIDLVMWGANQDQFQQSLSVRESAPEPDLICDEVGASEPPSDMADFVEWQRDRELEAAGRPKSELAVRAAQADPTPRQVVVTGTQFVRDPFVSEQAKRLANGACDLCGGDAPFLRANGTPYLESHHVEWLSHGGADSLDNVAALCPNCHRRMHILGDPADVSALITRLDNRKG